MIHPARSRTHWLTVEDGAFYASGCIGLSMVTTLMESGALPGYLHRDVKRMFDEQLPGGRRVLYCWVATNGLATVVAPALLMLSGPTPRERWVLGCITLGLLLQLELERRLGDRSERMHPIIGAAFTAYRLQQIRDGLGQLQGQPVSTFIPRTLLLLQRALWRTNLAGLCVVVAGASSPTGA